MQQDAFVAINIGDFAVTGGGAAVAGIVGEHAQVAVEFAYVGHRGSDRAGQQGQFGRFVGTVQADGERPDGGAAHGEWSSLD